MKILFTLALGLIPWLIIGVVAFAACGCLSGAFACGMMVVGCLLGASRLWDCIKNDAEWRKATRWEARL